MRDIRRSGAHTDLIMCLAKTEESLSTSFSGVCVRVCVCACVRVHYLYTLSVIDDAGLSPFHTQMLL